MKHTTPKLTADFTCSYAGETDYDIRQDGRIIAKVSERHFGNATMGYNGDYFETGIKKQIGTVRYYSHPEWLEFPDPRIVALFPGYVGCRLVFHETTPGLLITDPDYQFPTTEYQYDGPAPVIVQHSTVPNYLTFEGDEL